MGKKNRRKLKRTLKNPDAASAHLNAFFCAPGTPSPDCAHRSAIPTTLRPTLPPNDREWLQPGFSKQVYQNS